MTATIRMRQAPGFFWSLVSAVLGVVAGMLLLISPRGILSLTLILILFFLIEGIASIMYALNHKRALSGQWGLMMASGILDLALAAAVLVGLPHSAKWALGLLVGINLIFGGLALAAMALRARAVNSGSA